MREIVIGGAQMGPIQKADSREAVVARMMALLDQAIAAKCDLVVFPELTLTTFFPRWMMEDQAEVDTWFEAAMPNPPTQPLFDRAREAGVAISLGYAELTPEGRHFNTQILTDRQAEIIARYRKVHLPGHVEYETERSHQHLEKRYFEPGDLGFPVWRNLDAWMGMLICNDRRWPEAYREMGLQGVELVMLGYNTPTTNGQGGGEDLEKRIFHSTMSMQAGAYQNGCYVIGVAKGGREEGVDSLAESCIIAPSGTILADCRTEADEVIVAEIDLAETSKYKETLFDFERYRRPEVYGPITEQTGAIPPED